MQILTNVIWRSSFFKKNPLISFHDTIQFKDIYKKLNKEIKKEPTKPN
jgi:hypothetical protein